MMLGATTLTLPGALLNMATPMNRAMGTVQPMVNTPQGLDERALTTTTPRPARVTSRMSSTAPMATTPANGEISVRAISARDLPWCRMEATSTMKSWTQPARTAPNTIQKNPGANPNWAARVGPTSGPAPAMAAKWWPNITHLGEGT